MSSPEFKYRAVYVQSGDIPFHDAPGYCLRIACRIAEHVKKSTEAPVIPDHTGLSNYVRPEYPYPNLTMLREGFLIHYAIGWAGSDGFQNHVMKRLFYRLTTGNYPETLAPVPMPKLVKEKKPRKPKAKKMAAKPKTTGNPEFAHLVKGTDEYNREIRLQNKELYDDR